MSAKLPYPLAMLQRGESHDPFAVLGRQPDDGGALVRAFLPSAEAVAMELEQTGISYRSYERRLKSRRDQVETYSGFEFHHNHSPIQATVFPVDGIRQAPMSPVTGKPMKRLDADGVQALLQHV